jgi:hypothetical protein
MPIAIAPLAACPLQGLPLEGGMSAPSNLFKYPNCGASALASNLRSTSFRVSCCPGHCGKVVQHALSKSWVATTLKGGQQCTLGQCCPPFSDAAHLLASLPILIECTYTSDHYPWERFTSSVATNGAMEKWL